MPNRGENGVLAVLDYLWHQDGMRLPRSMIEAAIEDWKEQADYADELVALKAGGTEPRYRLSGVYDLTDPPKAVLPLMLDPMDARLYLRGDGSIAIEVGRFVSPDVTITDQHIISYSGMRRGSSKPDIRNVIRAKFVSPDYNFVEQDADPWVNQASIDVDGEQSSTLDLQWCPSHRQSRVRQKIEAYRKNPTWSGQIVTNAYGLRLLGKRYARFQIAELSIDTTFEIQKLNIELSSGQCTVSVISMPSQAWAWNPATDEGTAPGQSDPVDIEPEPDPPTAPTDLSSELDGSTIEVVFKAPNDLRLAACRVWRSETSDFEDAEDISDALYCSPNQILTLNDTPGTGPWFYWATAENLAGESSDPTGPTSETI